jgi:hypothetical protein
LCLCHRLRPRAARTGTHNTKTLAHNTNAHDSTNDKQHTTSHMDVQDGAHGHRSLRPSRVICRWPAQQTPIRIQSTMRDHGLGRPSAPPAKARPTRKSWRLGELMMKPTHSLNKQVHTRGPTEYGRCNGKTARGAALGPARSPPRSRPAPTPEGRWTHFRLLPSKINLSAYGPCERASSPGAQPIGARVHMGAGAPASPRPSLVPG